MHECHFKALATRSFKFFVILLVVVIVNDLRAIIGYLPSLLLLIVHFSPLNLQSLLFFIDFPHYIGIYISHGIIFMIFHPVLVIFRLVSWFSNCVLNMYELGLTCTNLNMKMHAERLKSYIFLFSEIGKVFCTQCMQLEPMEVLNMPIRWKPIKRLWNWRLPFINAPVSYLTTYWPTPQRKAVKVHKRRVEDC